MHEPDEKILKSVHCSIAPRTPRRALRRLLGRCAGHRQRPLLALVAGCAPGPDSQASVAGANPRATKTQFGELRETLTSKVFRGRPVFRLYSAFLA